MRAKFIANSYEFCPLGVDKAQVLGDTHGLRLKSLELENSLMEALQVVCEVDDRPKTDRNALKGNSVQVGNKFK